jgi:hypothetical protein
MEPMMTHDEPDVRQAMTGGEPEPFDRERIWTGIQRGHAARRRRRRVLQSLAVAAALGAVWITAPSRVDQPDVALLGDSTLRAAVGDLESAIRSRWSSLDTRERQALTAALATVDSVISELGRHRTASGAALALMTQQTDQVLEMKAQLLRDAAAQLTPVNRNSP